MGYNDHLHACRRQIIAIHITSVANPQQRQPLYVVTMTLSTGSVAYRLTLWAAFGPTSPGFASRPCDYSKLDSNLGQVVYSHCLTSLLSSKKLIQSKKPGYKTEYSEFGLDRFNDFTD